MILDTWANLWGVPVEALNDLRRMIGADPTHAPPRSLNPLSEAAVQQRIRLAEAAKGRLLWRNNNGAMMDADGRVIRFGLANDSKKMNEHIKSSDLIGITPHLVTTMDMGKTFGIFTSTEVKKEGWKFSNTPREQAQLRWGELVISKGGIFQFATRPEDIK